MLIADRSRVILPPSMMAESEDEVIKWIYGGGALCPYNADAIKESCILTPLNCASLEINHKVRQISKEENSTHKESTVSLLFSNRSLIC